MGSGQLVEGVRGRGCSGSSTQARCETEGPHASERTVFICFSASPRSSLDTEIVTKSGRAENWNPTT